MPIVAMSPSRCVYSWLFAYLLSSGVAISQFLTGRFASSCPLVERCRDHSGPRFLPSDQNRELVAWGGFVERKISESDRFFQCRRVGAAGDDADLGRAVDHRVSVTGDTAVDHLEPD